MKERGRGEWEKMDSGMHGFGVQSMCAGSGNDNGFLIVSLRIILFFAIHAFHIEYSTQ